MDDQQNNSNYQQPDNQQPNYQQPNYQQPNYQQPNYQQPNYQQPNYQQPNYQQQQYYQAPPQQDTSVLTEEVNIGVNIVLSIVTCGIYYFIWAYQIMKKIRIMQNDNNDVATELICFILVPVYNIYWFFSRAQRMFEAQKAWGKYDAQDNSVLYLLLAIFGFSFVSLALVQNDLNNFARFLKNGGNSQYQPPYNQ